MLILPSYVASLETRLNKEARLGVNVHYPGFQVQKITLNEHLSHLTAVLYCVSKSAELQNVFSSCKPGN